MRGFEPEPRICMDVSESDQAYMIKADIPGVKKKEKWRETWCALNATMANNIAASACRGKLTSPRSKPEYQDGVLNLTLLKKAGATSKPIPIQ